MSTKEAATILALQKALFEHKGHSVVLPVASDGREIMIWSGLVVELETRSQKETFVSMLGQRTWIVGLPLNEVIERLGINK